MPKSDGRKTASYVKPMSPEDLRADFELGLLFDGTGLETTAGCLKQRSDGKYDSPTIQNAWLGYQMCAGYAHGLLKRFDPERSVTPAMRTRYKELLRTKRQVGLDPDELPDLHLGIALLVAGAFPNG